MLHKLWYLSPVPENLVQAGSKGFAVVFQAFKMFYLSKITLFFYIRL